MPALSTAAVDAARRNHEEFLAELCRRYPGSAWHTGSEATWYMTGVNAAQFNGVVRVSDREGLEETVGITVRRFAGRTAPFYWYADDTAPDGLRSVLEHGSFVARDIEMPVLVAPAAIDAQGAGARVAVEVVDSGTALRAWEQAFFAASGLRSGNGQWVDMFQTVGYAAPLRDHVRRCSLTPAPLPLPRARGR